MVINKTALSKSARRETALNGGTSKRYRASETKASSDSLSDQIPFWMNLEKISAYQGRILQNWATLWFESMHAWVQLAPTNLWQNILGGWNVSLFQVVREMKGNPAVETRILKEAAGYGSQLGTLTDYVGVLARHQRLSLKNLEGEDAAKYVRFQDLISKIDRIKSQQVTP